MKTTIKEELNQALKHLNLAKKILRDKTYNNLAGMVESAELIIDKVSWIENHTKP